MGKGTTRVYAIRFGDASAPPHRLIRAESKGAARQAAQEPLTVTLATQDEIFAAAQGGLKIEDAPPKTEPAAAAPAGAPQ